MNESERLSLEYQKTQDSAEHYDNMVWTLISVGIGLSLTILYTVQTTVNLDILLKLLMLFVGAFSLTYFSYLIEGANEKKILKYKICQKIEKENKFIGQNLLVEDLPLSHFKKGIYFFRGIKILLLIIYALSIFVNGIIALYRGYSCTLLLSLIFMGIAMILSLVLEAFYISRSKQLNSILQNKGL